MWKQRLSLLFCLACTTLIPLSSTYSFPVHLMNLVIHIYISTLSKCHLKQNHGVNSCRNPHPTWLLLSLNIIIFLFYDFFMLLKMLITVSSPSAGVARCMIGTCCSFLSVTLSEALPRVLMWLLQVCSVLAATTSWHRIKLSYWAQQHPDCMEQRRVCGDPLFVSLFWFFPGFASLSYFIHSLHTV